MNSRLDGEAPIAQGAKEMLTPAPLSSSGGAQEPRSERGRIDSGTGFLTFAAENVLAPINEFPAGRRSAKRPEGEKKCSPLRPSLQAAGPRSRVQKGVG
jgi:hypothetical protein